MASENLTDYDDGGGMMSGNEIVSGNVNNMFPDISRLDRVYGRVSLRKAFISAMTDDNDVYSGVHVILDDPPDDPNVSVTLFTRKDYFDHRTDARDRIESYVVQGVRYNGYLLANQLEGARSIQIVQREELDLPSIGDVLYLVEGNYLYSQYVRITDISHAVRSFMVSANSGYVEIRRRVVTCETSDPLRYTFHGAEASYNDAHGVAVPYTASVADSAKYYGVKTVVEAVSPGTYTVRASGIFNHLVPSAQAESAIIDRTVSGQTQGLKEGGDRQSATVTFAPAAGSRFFCGGGVASGSFAMTSTSYSWADDGLGNIVRGGTAEGVIDYGSGVVTFSVSLPGAAYNVSWNPAVAFSGINRTLSVDVTLASRSWNYVATLAPLPVSGSVVVDYMSQGNWYRLRENGAGELIPDMTGTGTGVYNSGTGTVLLTCAALPDVDSRILFSWLADDEYRTMKSTVLNNAFCHKFILPKSPVEPGSVSFLWDGVAVSETLDEETGKGKLLGVTGEINYQTGEITVIPPVLKAESAGMLSINPAYRSPDDSVPVVQCGITCSAGPLNHVCNIGPVRASTVSMGPFSFGNSYGQVDLSLIDDGGGNLVTAVGSDKRIAGSSAGDPGGWVRVAKGVKAGTIEYSTGDVVVYGEIPCTVEMSEPVYGLVEEASSGTTQSGTIDDQFEQVAEDMDNEWQDVPPDDPYKQTGDIYGWITLKGFSNEDALRLRDLMLHGTPASA